MIQRCRKGDGVLTVGTGAARVVVEMHDSSDNRAWNEYLEISERNRGAAASIEIVRNATQNKGRASGSVRKSADDIDEECNTVQTGIGRRIWRGVADPTSAHHGEPPGNLDYSRL